LLLRLGLVAVAPILNFKEDHQAFQKLAHKTAGTKTKETMK